MLIVFIGGQILVNNVIWKQISKEILRRMCGGVWNTLASRIECSTIRLKNVDCCMKERVIYGSRM